MLNGRKWERLLTVDSPALLRTLSKVFPQFMDISRVEVKQKSQLAADSHHLHRSTRDFHNR